MAPQAGIPGELGAAVITRLGLMPEGEALSRALEAKTWLDSALTTVSAGTTALSVLSNPLHALFSGAANWAMEHIEPLKDWMNKLTGEPEHVRQAAAGWRGIGERLQADAASLNQSVTTDMAETEGLAVSAYADMQRDTAAHIAVLGGYAKALAFLLEEASTVVQKVRELVCKAISDVAAQAGQSAILTGCTLGLGTPIAIKQAADKVAEWAKKLSNIVNAVPRMAQAIQKTSQKGAVWLNKLDSGLKKRTAGKGSAHVVSKTSTKKRTKAPSKKPNTSTPKTKAPPKTNTTPKGGNGDVMSPDYHGLPEGYEPIRAPESYRRQPGRGGAPGSRAGEKFTPAGKDEVRMENAASHKDRLARCDNCDIIVSKPYQSKTGVTPPDHQAEVDHVIPRSLGGSGDPSNGACLCRACNQRKSNKY